MTNLDALRKLEMYCPTSCDNAISQLRRALEALEAVEVLDALAEATPGLDPFRTGRGEPDEQERWCCWTMDAPGKRKYFYGPTPHAARIAAAAAIKESK